MTQSEIKQAAESLRTAAETRKPIEPLTERYPGISIADAYAIQLQNVSAWQQAGARVIGKKIGLTSKAMQKMLNVPQPDYGFLLDFHVVAPGEPVSLGRLLQPRVESEIAFVLDRPLKGPGVTHVEVLRSCAGVLPAFEIIDSRIRDWKIKIQDTIADNASCGAIVLGPRLVPVGELDLRLTGLVLEHNGGVIDTAAGAAVLGHPAHAVAWLVNTLGALGVALEAGEVVLSGSLTKAYDARPGDHFEAHFGGLGVVSTRFAAQAQG